MTNRTVWVARAWVAEVTYEQCPWDREHVNSIYPVLGGVIAEDGDWHPTRDNGDGLGWYRVADGYFQALFAGEATPLLDEFKTMRPVSTQDDAEWEIWRLPEGGYAVSSTFATGLGPLGYESAANEWLFFKKRIMENSFMG